MFNIATLTFSPCIDKSTTVGKLLPDKKLYCSDPVFTPGGGGINVARAIKKLGGEALAIYPEGGYPGRYLNQLLKQEGIPVAPVIARQFTRENLVVHDVESNLQYRFGMPGGRLLESEWLQCLTVLSQHPVEYIVVSGSLPEGVPADLVARIAWVAKKKGQKLIVDTSGPPLKFALEEGVYMVKPNLHEIGILYNKQSVGDDAVILGRDIISKKQSEIVVVSMGPSGALLVTEKETIQYDAPAAKKVSTVGAGDSMVGGIVHQLSMGWTIKEAVRYGVACGTAATMNAGAGLCTRADVEMLYSAMQKLSTAVNYEQCNVSI